MRFWTSAAALALVAGMPALAATPAPSPTVKTGVDAWSRGDYAGAIKTWRPLAIAGDADAQFNMGQAYKLGRGVAVDMRMAEDWYRKAALQGHLQAEDNLGLIMFQNGDRQKAMPYIQRSAERGEPRAQYVLGTAMFNGDMVKKDWPRAYGLMTRASAAGIAPASASLAQMDKYIPLDQRQRGLSLARDMELAAQRPVLASAMPAEPPRAMTRPPIRTTEVPPSTPGVEFDPQPVEAAPAPVPAPKPVRVAPPPKQVAVVAAPAPRPVAPKPAVAAVSGGKWRVQLGAFGDANKARALWNTLENRVNGLSAFQPYLVKAGAVTRLQAGPLGSQGAADKLCASVRAAGNACLTVGI